LSSGIEAEEGMKIRRQVLGDEYVDRALNDPDTFARPFQELVTRSVWGNVWTRPGLPLKTRSLVTLGILTALGNAAEISLHTKAALRNGCTREEIQEVLLHAAAYCGAPAGVTAFGAAKAALKEVG
jgi:4-carboxymuconolactone decarboxylase